MKKAYEKPEIEITEFEIEDIISSAMNIFGGDMSDYGDIQ